MLPAGMSGTGHWNQEEMDKSFNAACRGSMKESFVKEPGVTPETYANIITKASKAFVIAWDVVCSSNIVVQGHRIPGAELEQLLNDNFTEKRFFQMLCSRIGEWAIRLQKACADNHETNQRSISAVVGLEFGERSLRRTLRRRTTRLRTSGARNILDIIDFLNHAWTLSSVIDIFIHITDLLQNPCSLPRGR